MVTEQDHLSKACRNRLNIQGYDKYSDEELLKIKWGIRFAPLLCALIAAIGLYSYNIPLLGALVLIAALGAILPYHPFDYLYNVVFHNILNSAKLPPRTIQGRFACGMGAVMMALSIYLLTSGLEVWGYITGYLVVAVATLVGTTDICIPSRIYNAFFLRK